MRKLKDYDGNPAAQVKIETCEGAYYVSGRLNSKVRAVCRFEPGKKAVCVKSLEAGRNFDPSSESRFVLSTLSYDLRRGEGCIL